MLQLIDHSSELIAFNPHVATRALFEFVGRTIEDDCRSSSDYEICESVKHGLKIRLISGIRFICVPFYHPWESVLYP